MLLMACVSRCLYSLSVMMGVKILKVVGRQGIGLYFLGVHVSTFLGSSIVDP